MVRKNLSSLALLLVFTVFTAIPVMSVAKERYDKDKGLDKAATLEYILYTANQINAYVGNNGQIVSHNVTGNSGLEWPAGSGKYAVFCSGLWVAGVVDGQIRSAASEYTSEYNPGAIVYDATTGTTPGYPDNPNDARFQVSSINKGDSSDPTNANYNREYATWPSKDGAPTHDGEYFDDADTSGDWTDGETFEDFNLDGVYNGPDGQLVTGQDPPNMVGDQMHWFVINDADENVHSNLWATQPLRIEVQTTVFGFDRADPLGNIMFIKWLVINKSGGNIDDMYISVWSDGDLGDAKDDYVGCDTDLSVGYFYNGTPVDQNYGNTPPSVGYDFFQGPIVASVGDTALVSGVRIPDYRNLPMTSFVKYTNGSDNYGDPENAEEAYHYMSGLMASGEPWIDNEGNVTTFLYPGDPNTRSGWTEYDDDTPDDRRFLMSSGPFDMQSWVDTNGDGFPQVGEPGVQEIVSAIIIAAGTSNTNAIGAMKFFDQYAQGAYDAQFNLPSPPSPIVRVDELDEQIILSWFEDNNKVESFSKLGYDFEGYNVYQGESVNGEWKLIGTYDVVNNVTTVMDQKYDIDYGLVLEGPVQFGTDAGIANMMDIRSDAVRGNQALINNRTYYFAVTAYAYNPDGAPKTVESSKTAILVMPHEPALGQALYHESNEDLLIDHVGAAETSVSATVINPLMLTGDNYAVRFAYDSTTAQGSWYMGSITENGTMLDTLIKSTVLDSITTDMIDGFTLTVKNIVFQPTKLCATWPQTVNIVGTQYVEDPFVAVSPGGVDSLIYMDGDTVKIDTLYGPTHYYDDFYILPGYPDDFIVLTKEITHNVMITGFASAVFGKNHLLSSIPGVGGGITDPKYLQADIEIRFTEEGSMASLWPKKDRYLPRDTMLWVPFEVWDVENNMRLCIGVGDNDKNGVLAHPDLASLDDDWVVTIHKDYNEYGDSIFTMTKNPDSGWLWMFSTGSRYSVGDIVHLFFLNPVDVAVDEYVFNPAALDENVEQSVAEEQLKLINVFPNPYFAFNVEETQPLTRFVRFTHLPLTDATLRIYSLGGQFVKKIEHGNSDYAGQSIDAWDLTNHAGVPVASGMYIVHIDIPNVGEKILKLAVFMPEERLDIY